MNKNRIPGELPSPSDLINPAQLVTAYYAERPDSGVPAQRVSFGTSGHRGSALQRTFNEDHILAITQAICAYRKKAGVDGPLFLGIDTHALSEPAAVTALEVLAANDVVVMTAAAANEHSYFGYTPTPAVSHAILRYNRGRTSGLSDGVVITPSHNPPEDGGFKYNPPHGGPAEGSITKAIQDQANEFLERGLEGVKRVPFARAREASRTHDFLEEYVRDLGDVLDLEVIRGAGVKVGVDPLGGAGVRYWGAIADRYRLNLTVLDDVVDPTFRFMTLDWDGRIRMDPSSAYAMRRVIEARDKFDVTVACDTDHDRHGIVTRSAGLLSPNQYLAVCVDYLCRVREGWKPSAGIGKTVVSSSLIDRVTAKAGRKLYEVPVGFKWFVEGLFTGSLVFGGEESAGASFLTRDHQAWSTDKDGIAAALLAAEMTARGGRDPGELFEDLCREHGRPVSERIDAPANAEQRARLAQLSAKDITASQLAGEPIEQILTTSPAGGHAIGGVKVITRSGWFAARPSGTEDVYKIYAESFRDHDHLVQIQEQAQAIIAGVLGQTSGVVSTA